MPAAPVFREHFSEKGRNRKKQSAAIGNDKKVTGRDAGWRKLQDGCGRRKDMLFW